MKPLLSARFTKLCKNRGAVLIIRVDVRTDAREEDIEKLGEDWYIVRVKAPKKKGKANAAVIKILNRHLNGRVRIISGHKSTRKIIEITK